MSSALYGLYIIKNSIITKKRTSTNVAKYYFEDRFLPFELEKVCRSWKNLRHNSNNDYTLEIGRLGIVLGHFRKNTTRSDYSSTTQFIHSIILKPSDLLFFKG